MGYVIDRVTSISIGPKMKRIFFSFIPVLALFLMSEIVLRLMDWPKITAAFEHNVPFWSTDPDLSNKKFAHKEEKTHFYVSTNEDGLRSTSDKVTPLESNKKRIMTLGCSTTFGWGVSDQESYPSVLQELIQSKNPDYEVVNGGQPGFTSFQGLWFWNKILKKYIPNFKNKITFLDQIININYKNRNISFITDIIKSPLHEQTLLCSLLF